MSTGFGANPNGTRYCARTVLSSALPVHSVQASASFAHSMRNTGVAAIMEGEIGPSHHQAVCAARKPRSHSSTQVKVHFYLSFLMISLTRLMMGLGFLAAEAADFLRSRQSKIR